MDTSIWNRRYNFTIFSFTIFLFWSVILIYHERIISPGYLVAALLVIFFFFFLLNYCDKHWSGLSSNDFTWKLIVWAFFVRLAAVIGLYFFYKYQTGISFEFHAVDSLFYHERARFIADNFSKMNFNVAEMTKDLEFSDKGYNVYLGFIYYLFGPQIIVPRLINAVFSTLTVYYIYKIAQQTVGERSARIAAIMALLLPNFLLYLGTHLKETLMLFLMTLALYQAVRIVKLGNKTVSDIIMLAMVIFSLFMFRTVLALATFASVLAYAILYKPPSRNIYNVFSISLILIIFAFLIVNSDVGNEVAAYYEKRSNAISDNMQFRAAREGGNKYALMASAPLFISIIVMAPFPSFVFVFQQENLWMFLGANFVKNMYAFFALAGIIYSIRFAFRERSLLLAFVLGYLGILANSGFAISERFHLPVLPALLILAAAGVNHLGMQRRSYFGIYLFLIAILIVGWNYIKLAGRM